MTQDEEFPFNNQYYDLIKGQTISKRGVWWTALLLVKNKDKETDLTSDESKSNSKKEKENKIAKKVIIQRWRRFKQGEDGFRWNRSKDFTISSKKQWETMKTVLDEWVNDKSWD